MTNCKLKAVLLATALMATPAVADVTIPQGDWHSTFIERSSTGAAQCVLSTLASDGKMFMLKYFTNDTAVVEVFDTRWKGRMKEGSRFKFKIGFNNQYVVEIDAVVQKDGDGGGYYLKGGELARLLDGLASGPSMSVSFPSTVKPFEWILSTYGAPVAKEQFRMCALALYAGNGSSPPSATESNNIPPTNFKNGKGGI